MHDPYSRMKCMVKYYLSGFYKKPKGLKKPYNPILGEIFRCCWQHDDKRDSKTYYIAEQVSHHPPISTFHITNRAAGYNACGTILAKSKFYGNSLSAIMIGEGRVSLLERGEDYTFTLPYAHCKGLILGTLTMELGGEVTIACERTRYTAEIDFKLRPFFGGAAQMNAIAGRIRLGEKTMATFEGHWDGVITLTDKVTGGSEVLWEANPETVRRRLPRYQVPLDQQDEWESQRLWSKVTEAIMDGDQVRATEEKFVLEDAQRKRARELKESDAPHVARLFDRESNGTLWQYKYADYRPWDDTVDVKQVENEFCVRTVGRTRMQPVRSRSIHSILGAKPAVGEIASRITTDDGDERGLGTDDERDNDSMQKRSGSPELCGAAEMKRVMADALKPVHDELRTVCAHIKAGKNANAHSLDRSVTLFELLGVLAVCFAVHAVLMAWLVRKYSCSYD